MSANVEHSLLVVWDSYLRAKWASDHPGQPDPDDPIDETEPHEARYITFEHFGSGADAEEIRETPVAAALEQLARAADSGRGPDLTAAVQGLVLATRVATVHADSPVQIGVDELRPLARALLTAVDADHGGSDALLGAAEALTTPGIAINGAPAGLLADAFGGLLVTRDSLLYDNSLTFSGPAAFVAAQLTDLSQSHAQVGCEVSLHGKEKQRVTSVILETCTALPYETCRQRIDPRRWPDCNPYFDHVTPFDPWTATTNPKGWYGSVNEEVGPGLNLSYYSTDLGIRYVEDDRMAATAFTLAKPRSDGKKLGDGRVTWDSGFLAVIDEGAHRRIQMCKDYRIKDLDVALDWICPLWSSQFVVAAWACSCADSLRRGLRAWSRVTRDVLDVGQGVCDSLHGECPEHDKPERRSRVAPLGITEIDIPNSYDCPRSHLRRGSVQVPVPPKKQVGPTGQANRLTPESGALTPTNVSIQPAGAALAAGAASDTVHVSLPTGATSGLYVGRVTASGVDEPYTIYVSDLP